MLLAHLAAQVTLLVVLPVNLDITAQAVFQPQAFHAQQEPTVVEKLVRLIQISV